MLSNTVIQVRKSGVSGNTPTDLNVGELALNYADGKLFYKNSSNVISSIENQQTFSTVNVDSTLVVASSPNDIVSFVSGSNITLSPDAVNKKITINAIPNISFGSLLTSNIDGDQVLDSFESTQYRTVKYLIQAISDDKIHSCEVIVTHNDIETFASQYGIIKSTRYNLFTLSSSMYSGIVRLLITPVNPVTQIDFQRISLVARTLPVT